MNTVQPAFTRSIMRIMTHSWTATALDIVLLVALMPPIAAAIIQRGTPWLVTLGACVLTVLGWQLLFAVFRRRSFGLDGLAAAIIFALLVPGTLPLWQVLLSLSFGIILGQEVFGGRGFGFLNPAVVAMAFLLFSFPGVIVPDLQMLDALAVIPGLLLLLVSGLASWRVLIGVVIGFLVSALLAGVDAPWDFIVTGSFVFGVVFLISDPVASASTRSGRWVYGGLFGGVVVLLGGSTDGQSMQPIIFAAMLASIASPLIDQGVMHLNALRRRRRNG